MEDHVAPHAYTYIHKSDYLLGKLDGLYVVGYTWGRQLRQGEGGGAWADCWTPPHAASAIGRGNWPNVCPLRQASMSRSERISVLSAVWISASPCCYVNDGKTLLQNCCDYAGARLASHIEW